MKLTTLRPRLSAIATQRVPTLTTATERPRGRSWMETRKRIQVRDRSVCCDCGLLWQAHKDHVDHQVPLEHGGSNDDTNLRLRCWKCHNDKSKGETALRGGKGG